MENQQEAITKLMQQLTITPPNTECEYCYNWVESVNCFICTKDNLSLRLSTEEHFDFSRLK